MFDGVMVHDKSNRKAGIIPSKNQNRSWFRVYATYTSAFTLTALALTMTLTGQSNLIRIRSRNFRFQEFRDKLQLGNPLGEQRQPQPQVPKPSRPPVVFSKGFLQKNKKKVTLAPKHENDGIGEDELSNVRWCLLYEPLAARYGITPADPGVKIIHNSKDKYKNVSDRTQMPPRPLDFGLVAEAFNAFDRTLYMGTGGRSIVGDIEVKSMNAEGLQNLKENATLSKGIVPSVDEALEALHLPGVQQTGMPAVLRINNESIADERALLLGRRRHPSNDPIELKKERDMLIQVRAAVLLGDQCHEDLVSLMNTLDRRDREDLDCHLLGARIVFDMSYEDLKYERDDAEESVRDLFDTPGSHMNVGKIQKYPALAKTLRKRGQERAYHWWHQLREKVGNETSLQIIRQDKHLMCLGEITEKALGLSGLNSTSSSQQRYISQTEKGSPTNVHQKVARMSQSLSEQRKSLMEWAVRDTITKEDMLSCITDRDLREDHVVREDEMADVSD
mmetsp:Transcript_19562/g.27302  ORF Transcript_19562/g.27302 Transcript_19562/m.27302 type:complete len:504 (-) Transcript_19562:104-1615(-)